MSENKRIFGHRWHSARPTLPGSVYLAGEIGGLRNSSLTDARFDVASLPETSQWCQVDTRPHDLGRDPFASSGRENYLRR